MSLASTKSLDETLAKKLPILRDRSRLLQEARAFFLSKGLLEIDCGSLVRCAPVDSHIDVMEVAVTEEQTGYLHTSPEYALKRLLAAGSGDIFFLGHVYRKGEIGSRHNPEFLMAEWYRTELSYPEMIQETCEFLFLFLGKRPIRHLSYRKAFEEYVGIDYTRAPLEELKQALQKNDIQIPSDLSSWNRETFIHLLLTHVIEPHLGQNELTVLLEYPPQEAALACVIEKEGEQVAERFEIYGEGIELANGYHELADADELRKRFTEENQIRLARGQDAYVLDEKFLAALQNGFPSCCGVSVGVDRAMMVRHNTRFIQDVIPFSWDES